MRRFHTALPFPAATLGINIDFVYRDALIAIARDPSTNLAAGVAAAPSHSIERCLLIVGNHNSYHLGEFSILRQVMDNWGSSHS